MPGAMPDMKPQTAHKLLHIFKPGRHVTATGEAIEFSAADLEATARAYDPALHKAPLVIGHGLMTLPAEPTSAASGMVVRTRQKTFGS